MLIPPEKAVTEFVFGEGRDGENVALLILLQKTRQTLIDRGVLKQRETDIVPTDECVQMLDRLDGFVLYRSGVQPPKVEAAPRRKRTAP